MGFGGDGDGGGGGRGGARDGDSVALGNGGGCPIITEMDCAASRGQSNFYGDCLERERELGLGRRVLRAPFGVVRVVTNSVRRRLQVLET